VNAIVSPLPPQLLQASLNGSADKLRSLSVIVVLEAQNARQAPLYQGTGRFPTRDAPDGQRNTSECLVRESRVIMAPFRTLTTIVRLPLPQVRRQRTANLMTQERQAPVFSSLGPWLSQRSSLPFVRSGVESPSRGLR
jgi:hypothetical protein